MFALAAYLLLPASVRADQEPLREDGSTWRQIALPGRSIQALARDPQDPLLLYALTFPTDCKQPKTYDGSTFFKSTDGGQSWQGSKVGTGGCGLILADIDIDAGGTVYVVGPSDGVGRSTDGGLTWTFTAHRSPTTDSGETVRSLPDTGTYHIRVDPIHPGTIFTDGNGRAINRSSDGGKSWEQIGPTVQFVSAIAVARDAPDTVFFTGAWDGLWRSSDDGQGWSDLTEQRPQGNAHLITVGSADGHTLYVAIVSRNSSEGGLWRSTDGGASWQQTQSGRQVALLTADRRDLSGNSVVFADYQGGVFLSQDGGTTLRPLQRPTVNYWAPRSFLQIGDTLLLGTDEGIWQITLPPASDRVQVDQS
jgi:hypothetical protein